MRFLGGLEYGLLIIFASYAHPNFRTFSISTRSTVVACAISLLPWLSIQLDYARQFFAVSLGLEKDAFYERYVPFIL
jgi:hypothetical protein